MMSDDLCVDLFNLFVLYLDDLYTYLMIFRHIYLYLTIFG